MWKLSLVVYKIGYIVNFVSNPDCRLDSKWRSRNRGWWDGLKKTLVQFLDARGIDPMQQCDGSSCFDSNELKKNEHDFPCLCCYCNTSVMFVLQMQCKRGATIQRSCACRTGKGQTVQKWRQLWCQLLEADSYVRGT